MIALSRFVYRVVTVMTIFSRPLYNFLAARNFVRAKSKYLPIRPGDAMLYLGLCGWATVISMIVPLVLLVYTNVWIAVGGLLVSLTLGTWTLFFLGDIFLDHLLAHELKSMTPDEKAEVARLIQEEGE